VPNGLFPGRAAGGRGGCGTFVILEGLDEGVDGGIDGEIVCGASGIFFSTAGISTSLFLATVFLGAAFFTGFSSAGLFTGGYFWQGHPCSPCQHLLLIRKRGPLPLLSFCGSANLDCAKPKLTYS